MARWASLIEQRRSERPVLLIDTGDFYRARDIALHLGRLKDEERLRPQQVSLGKLNNVREALTIARECREHVVSAIQLTSGGVNVIDNVSGDDRNITIGSVSVVGLPLRS